LVTNAPLQRSKVSRCSSDTERQEQITAMGLPPTSCPARATPGAFRRAAQGLAATALCLGGLAGTADAALPPAQRAALVDLYNASNGPGWTNSSNWLVGDPCNDGWFGIGCGGGGTTVTSVELPNNQLRGNLGPLADLPGLTTFNVHTNQLTGPIPALAGLASLSYFVVDGNQLSGALPDLAGLANLGVFNASRNQLTGSIPPLSGLASLSYFSVSSNRLTGQAPDLTGLNALQALLVAGNQLSGPVPVAPGSLQANSSSLCPNLLTPATGSANDLAWNTATGRNPWSASCTQPVVPVPTLHEAALAGLMLVLAGIAALRLRRTDTR
jgi:hypothetical protein